MADARARRHRVEIGEALRPPFQEVVALHIALIFDLHIVAECRRRAEFIDHHRMVDDEVHRHQRVDLAGIAAQLRDRIAHGGKIDHAGHAGEILQQHAGRAILDFIAGLARVFLPVDDRLDVAGRNGEAAILEPEQIFQQHLHGKGQTRHIAQLLPRLSQRINGVMPAMHRQRLACAQSVLSDCSHISVSIATMPGPVRRGDGREWRHRPEKPASDPLLCPCPSVGRSKRKEAASSMRRIMFEGRVSMICRFMQGLLPQ